MEGESEIKLRSPRNSGIAKIRERVGSKPKILKYIGPAFIVSVAYIDPGNNILRRIMFLALSRN